MTYSEYEAIIKRRGLEIYVSHKNIEVYNTQGELIVSVSLLVRYEMFVEDGNLVTDRLMDLAVSLAKTKLEDR